MLQFGGTNLATFGAGLTPKIGFCDMDALSSEISGNIQGQNAMAASKPFPHESTVVALYEQQGCNAEDIAGAVNIPVQLVEIILEQKSPMFRADRELIQKTGKDINGEDIPDRIFARVRQETFQLALNRNTPVYARVGLLKYLWDKKRPTKVEGNSGNITQINIALQQARETLKAKLEI